MTKIVNLFAGPGTGKSTTAAALFAELKYRGVNCEYIPEFAKDAAWEGNRDKLFAQQDMIFAEQHWRIARVIDEVDLLVTDCPLLMGLVYIPDDYHAPSLRNLVIETHDKYSTGKYQSLNVFLKRNKPYNPKGRLQTEEGAKALDAEIFNAASAYGNGTFVFYDFSRKNPQEIINQMLWSGWDRDIPALLNDQPESSTP